MSEPVGEIVFPIEWKRGHAWGPGHPEIMLSNDDGDMIAAGGVLEDGTNLVGLCWPGGQRVYRISPDTGWAIEERFEGEAPETVQKVWGILVDCAVNGIHDAEAELGRRRR